MSKSPAPAAPSSRRYSANRSKSSGSPAPPHASPDAPAAPDAVVPGAPSPPAAAAVSFLRADEADVYRGRETVEEAGILLGRSSKSAGCVVELAVDMVARSTRYVVPHQLREGDVKRLDVRLGF